MSEPKTNLVYTVAIDPPGYGGTRQLAKMLAASLARSFWSGDVLVFRNSPQPLFLVQREGLNEVYIETPEEEWNEALRDARLRVDNSQVGGRPAAEAEDKWTIVKAQSLANYAMKWKCQAREFIDAQQFEWIVFLDADSLALRNLDHLLPSAHGVWEWDGETPDILYQPEPGRGIHDDVFDAYLEGEQGVKSEVRGRMSGIHAPSSHDQRPESEVEGPEKVGLRYGINSGTWAVRGEHFAAVLEEWERIQDTTPRRTTIWTEQGAWNRLILDCKLGRLPWRVAPLEHREIQFPLHLDRDWKKYKDAAIVHAVGGTPEEKIEFLFGMFIQKFYADDQTTLVNILDM